MVTLRVEMIIFSSIRFLSKTSNQTEFFKKQNRNRFKPTGFGSFFWTKTGLARFFRFCSVFRFGLILAQFFFRFGSVFFWFFQFQAYKTETEPNRLVFSKF